MMRSLFLKTLYQKRFMMIGWFIAMTAVTFLTVAVYDSFSDGSISKSLESMPPALQKLAGDALSFQTIGGYISQQVFALRSPLMLIIVAIAVVVGLTAGNEERGLTETQMSLPVGRTKLMLHTLAAATVVVGVAGLGVLAGIQAGLLVIGQAYPLLEVLPHLIGCLLLAMCYGLIGFLVAAAGGSRPLALGVSGGLAFLGFLINSMAPSVQVMAELDTFTLFHYYVFSGGYDWASLGLLAGLAVAMTAVGLVLFSRRDIRSR